MMGVLKMLAGNVWYFKEIARKFGVFEGDDPNSLEFVDIDGSWKAGRDGSEPGIGLIVEVNPDTGERVELELFTPES